jgi:uncharacterized protein (DUF2252 family)
MNTCYREYGSRGTGTCRQFGFARRQKIPLAAHAEWEPPPNRADPVETLIEYGKSRIAELLPVRYSRMATDPFAFLRGAAAIMAADLAAAPSTDLCVQSCGDCHFANFNTYRALEGAQVFDIQNFDETLPAPFEWDVKRLAASLVVAGRVAELANGDCRRLARMAAGSYRKQLAHLAERAPLDAWGTRLDLGAVLASIDSKKVRRRVKERFEAVLRAGTNHFGLVERKNGDWKIKDRPLLVQHMTHHELHARQAFASYAETLPEDQSRLLQRYHWRDVAFRTVGVGSVGLFNAIVLFVSESEAPLLLQITEAQESVLAPYAGGSDYSNHGQRIVIGQRILQAASDVFLGWTPNPVNGRHFYIRRLTDARLANLGAMRVEALPFYAALCGRALARAHARGGDSVEVSGYLGDGREFENAIAEFAFAYALQTERDWSGLLDTLKAGRISAEEHARST